MSRRSASAARSSRSTKTTITATPVVGLWLKAPEGMQRALVEAQPERFYVPKYVGPKGWVGVRMDGPVDWAMVDELVRQSYRLIAPKRLVATLE